MNHPIEYSDSRAFNDAMMTADEHDEIERVESAKADAKIAEWKESRCDEVDMDCRPYPYTMLDGVIVEDRFV